MSSHLFEIWSKSKVKRRLLSIRDCINIALRIKIIESHRKNRFKWFIHYLIEKSDFCPIYQEDTTCKPECSEIKYFFHPLQFLEIVDIYLQIFRKRIYYTEDEIFERYLFTKEKENKLKELHLKMEKMDKPQYFYMGYDKEFLSKLIEEWKAKEFQFKHQLSFDVLTDLNRFRRSSFNQEELGTWMKMEELFPEIQCLTRMYFDNQESKKNYDFWRDQINLQNYFSNEELSHLKSILTYFSKVIRRFSNKIDKISDLLEYCPWNDFSDKLWYSSQLIILQRTLVKILYLITGDNYSITNKIIKGKPDYYFKNEKDFKDWITSVLIHRNLLIKPLKIIVEGKTESDLLKKYSNEFWQEKWVDIIKEEGITNTLHYKRVFSSIDFEYYWYLFDYDEGQHKGYDQISTKTWFFPDFVTEVFTVDQALGAYKDVISSKNLEFSRIYCEETILEELNKIKEKSDKMIIEYPNIQTTCLGYEKYFIEQSFDKIEVRKKVFPNYDKYETSYQDLGKKTKKILGNIFKEVYGKYLMGYLIEISDGRAKRNEIFDMKMKDAFSYFNSITNKKFESFLNH